MAGGGAGEVEEEGAFADAAGADEGDALAVTEEAEDLVDFGGTAVEICGVADGATMVERVVDSHKGYIVMRNGRSVK